MARVVMIGIDGLDADLLRVYGPALPHLRRLMLESPFLELKASFPPETVSTWASIYTGLNPANHGILGRESYGSFQAAAEGAPKLKISPGETFWDIAGHAGKRVCVLNPLLASPAWPVNGLMLSLPTLLNSPVVPSALQLKEYCHSLYTLTLQQVERALELFQLEPWDIFFLQLDALDHAQHFLWRYNDPGDPTYPGQNKHSNRIHDFYRLFDSIVGRFRSAMEEDCVLLVVSGHGHGRSCVQCFHLNEWLRNQGLLTPRASLMRRLDRRYLVERAKHRSIELLAELHLQDVILRIPRYLPGQGGEGHAGCIIDRQATMAQAVELNGTSPFGGIRLNRACLERKGEEYERVRNLLLQDLSRLRLQGRPAVHWAKTRESVYQGKYIESYPDILFELRSDIGISSNIYVPPVTSNLAHRMISGNHRMYGVLLVGNMPGEVHIVDDVKEPGVMDVAPMLLHLTKVASPDRSGQILILPSTSKLPK